MQLYYSDFLIADIGIRLITETPLKIAKDFEEFRTWSLEEKAQKYLVFFKEVDHLDIPDEFRIYDERRFSVYQLKDGTYYRVFKEYAGDRKVYASSTYDFTKNIIRVEYLARGKEHFENVQKAFLHIAWEVILIHERKLILHASFLETEYGGIAFSGPSGIGKSTQGNLWCQYGNARLLNGDKVILSEKHGTWMGYGSPYAGSSLCYVNDSCLLKGIFFLKQGKECNLRSLGVAESFKKIYAGLTINYWDSDYVGTACDLAQQLAMDIPAFEFTCTPDEDAVYFLQQQLQKGGVMDGRICK